MAAARVALSRVASRTDGGRRLLQLPTGPMSLLQQRQVRGVVAISTGSGAILPPSSVSARRSVRARSAASTSADAMDDIDREEGLLPTIKRHTLSADAVGRSGIKDPTGSLDRAPWQRSSLSAVTPGLDDEELNCFIDAELERFIPMVPRALSMAEILDMIEPERMAKFLQVEVPVRYAERLHWISEIDDWEAIPELAQVYVRHKDAFRKLRLVKRSPNLDEFTEVVTEVVASQRDVQNYLAVAFHRLRLERGEKDYGFDFSDAWLDKFLLNCIGTEMLMNQYLACVHMKGQSGGGTFAAGVIDPQCDVAQVCRDVADATVEMCEEITGIAPLVRVQVYKDRGDPKFSYIPGFLRFMLAEILKNSCRATAELIKSDRDIQKRPITIIVCCDDNQVAIRVTDLARGIPFESASNVWSYLFSTSPKAGVVDEASETYGEGADSLAGYGVGLPLSRLYARYLGGSLNIVSLPGYGTSVDLFLTKINSEQREVVPDDDDDA